MEVNDYLEADQIIIDHTLKVAVCKEKVSFLEDVVRTLSFRNSTIRNIIDEKRFKAGVDYKI